MDRGEVREGEGGGEEGFEAGEGVVEEGVFVFFSVADISVVEMCLGSGN